MIVVPPAQSWSRTSWAWSRQHNRDPAQYDRDRAGRGLVSVGIICHFSLLVLTVSNVNRFPNHES